jgi:hypothetical protein
VPHLADVGDTLAEDVGGHVDGVLLLVVDGFHSGAINLGPMLRSKFSAIFGEKIALYIFKKQYYDPNLLKRAIF